MFNPISIEKDDYIELRIQNSLVREIYVCIECEEFTDAQNSPACRYKMVRTFDNDEIWLEVKKDRAHNYQLFYYEKVEELDYNPTFLALLGSTTIGYNAPATKKDEQIIYNIIHKKGEQLKPIKHIVDADELPENPNAHGYYKDANENWYFMTKQSNGSVKTFHNQQKRSWEYKNSNDRLLIEMQEGDIYSDISIYEGQEIARRDLKKIDIREVELELA
jgi:hypothetical protein